MGLLNYIYILPGPQGEGDRGYALLLYPVHIWQCILSPFYNYVHCIAFALDQLGTQTEKSEILVIFIWATHGHQAPSGNHLFRPPLRPPGQCCRPPNFRPLIRKWAK
jgi:hypothetical protein